MIALIQLLVAPLTRNPGSDNCTDAGAANGVNLQTVFTQGAHHAQMRKTPRTAAAEHQSGGVAGQKPGNSRDILAAPDVMDQRVWVISAPRICLAGQYLPLVQHN